MPDAPGLELIREEIEQDHPGAILDTGFDRGGASLVIDPAQALDVLRWLHETPGQEYTFLSSLHAADYLPAEPRFAVHYELLNRDRVERIRVKALLGDPAAGPVGAPAAPPRVLSGGEGGAAGGVVLDPPPPQPPADETGESDEQLPSIDSCVELFPTAEFQEREAFDMFGIVFRGHPDLTRILLPDDYVGWPQRRDFPVGGEPVIFTYNEGDRG
jgi:NADH-quinone oxidoreductase subunit C